MVMISIVIPIYNEQESIPELHTRLVKVLEEIDREYEVIFVNDGSVDGSLSILRDIHEKNHRFKSISFTRNFGHQTAISAGLMFAKGNAIIIMDGDLQDPPEMLPKFIDEWEKGNKVVYAIRTNRKESFFMRGAYFVFYRLLRFMTNVNIPVDTGDFCLMDKEIVNLINSLPERARFVRGLRSWVGFKQVGIRCERSRRFAGKSKYSFWKLVRLAFDGIFSLSAVPLKIATAVGIIVSGLSLLFSLYVIFNYVFGYKMLFINISPGWASLIVSITFLGGIQLISIGILGEYVSRIFGEVKRRPHFIIDTVIGIDGKEVQSSFEANSSKVVNLR
jgi:dolichol-phosphate mannosyltransferase